MTHVHAVLAGYESWVRASGASPETLRLRRHHLKHLIVAYAPTPLHRLTTSQLTEFLSRDGWAPETRRSARSAIRSYFTWAQDVGLTNRDPSRKLPTIRVPQGKPKPTPEAVFAQALLAADARGRLMLMLAGYAGLRRAEIARVHTDDVGDELRVHGKGGKVRCVPLHPIVRQELEQLGHSGWVFPGKDEGHLSPGHVGFLMRRMLGAGWSGHTLRHKFASGFFNASKDLLLTQQILGHSKPETTMRYVLVDRSAAAAIVAGL